MKKRKRDHQYFLQLLSRIQWRLNGIGTWLKFEQIEGKYVLIHEGSSNRYPFGFTRLSLTEICERLEFFNDGLDLIYKNNVEVGL